MSRKTETRFNDLPEISTGVEAEVLLSNQWAAVCALNVKL